MNTKKRSLLILLIFVLIVSVMCFVACNDNEDTTQQEEEIQSGEYENATYTVTYDANGGTTNASWMTRTYTYGDQILQPTYTPVKSGYTFLYWSTAKSGSAYDFSSSSIEADLTLYAVFQASTVQHSYNLKAVLVKNGEDEYTIEETYEYGFMQNESTVITTQYGNSSSSLAIPYTDNPTQVNGIQDYFCFWYYLEDGKPVRFSTVATSSSTSVTVLSAYNEKESLTLYPMWLSTLPTIEVTFKDTKSELVYGTLTGYYNDTIDVDYNPIKSKTGYEFTSWTYTDVDDETQTFYFDDSTDETIDATTISDMVDYDYFNEQKITVYANWCQKLMVSSLSEYEVLYNKIRTLDVDSDEYQELIAASIEFTSIDFSGSEFEELFDKDHIFKGTILGNNAGDKAEFSNGVFKGSSTVSVFGYVQGTIKNISIKNTQFVINEDHDDIVSVSGIATKLLSNSTTDQGLIFDCDVEMAVNYTGIDTLNISGIVAENIGVVQKCSVTISSFTATTNTLSFGGITVKNKATASLLQNKAVVTLTSANAQDAFTFGAIAASNSGEISACEGNVTATALSTKSLVFGTLVGDNTSSLEKSKATLAFGTDAAPILLTGTSSSSAYVGGAVGKSSGQVKNIYTTISIYATANNSSDVIYIGGLIASNSSLSTSSTAGAVYYSYAQGDIKLTVADDISATTYVGGLIGCNKQNGISSVFSLVNVSVMNKSGNNNIGFLMGTNKASSSFTLTYGCDDNKLYKNGTAYTIDDIVEITVLTNECNYAKGNFCMTSNVFGTSTGNLKWDNTIWTIEEDQVTLPVLIWEE